MDKLIAMRQVAYDADDEEAEFLLASGHEQDFDKNCDKLESPWVEFHRQFTAIMQWLLDHVNGQDFHDRSNSVVMWLDLDGAHIRFTENYFPLAVMFKTRFC